MSERTRNWTFLVYPESMPEDFFSILSDFHIPAIVSPLHDSDINADGELKKPHYHVMFAFDGPKSFDQIMRIVQPLGVSHIEIVHDFNAMARYFAHIDNPEKARYRITDYKVFGGINLEEALRPGKDQVRQYISEMMDYIINYRIFEFCDLMNFARQTHYDTWYYSLTTCCANIMIQYINSWRNKNKGVKKEDV